MKRIYRCNYCGRITEFLCLADITVGCVKCSFRSGFQKSTDNGKTWIDRLPTDHEKKIAAAVNIGAKF